MSKTDRTHRRVRFHHVVGATIAISLLVGPVTAWAIHDFDDVPDSNPFHDEISWMADTNITTGFPDGTFHPADPVTRQAMSAFMERLYNLQAGLNSVATGTDGGGITGGGFTNITGAAATVTIPAGTIGRVIGTFSAEVNCQDGAATVIIVLAIRPTCNLRILRNGATMLPASYSVIDSDDTNFEPDNVIDTQGTMIQSTSIVLGPGTHTLQAQMGTTTGDAGDPVVMDVNEFMLRAEVVLSDHVVIEL
jgi:hypothetical protein